MSHYDEHYFYEIFKLLSEDIRPDTRETFQAYDGVNNLFNLGYELLSWKVHRALVRAKLEPFLGYLHSIQEGKLSLIILINCERVSERKKKEEKG